jgi:hypothetical protein
LLVFEVGLRLYDGVRVLRITNFIRDRVDQADVHYSVYDEQLGWITKPDFHRRFFNTGRYGIRLAGGVDRPVPQGAILATGDSFTFGEEVDDNESWPAILETITHTQVVNAATGAWGTDQTVMRAEQMIEIAHPNVIVVGIFWPDMDRTEMAVFAGSPKPYFAIEEGELVLKNVPVPRFRGMMRELGLTRTILGYSYTVFWLGERLGLQHALYGAYTASQRAMPEGTGVRVTCLLLRRLKEQTDREHIRLLLVMQYAYQDFPGSQPAPAAAVLRCAADLTIATVDMWSLFDRIKAENPNRFHSFFNFRQSIASHMSAAGNAVVAEEIARRLKTDN